jgi:hypothetical protein
MAGISDLEVGFSARTSNEWDNPQEVLTAFSLIETDSGHVRRAPQVQRLLASRSQRSQGPPPPGSCRGGYGQPDGPPYNAVLIASRPSPASMRMGGTGGFEHLSDASRASGLNSRSSGLVDSQFDTLQAEFWRTLVD